MGTLVTLHLPPGSPIAEQPWVITIASLGDMEDWEPLVCGPYERAHALALARAVVADDDLMAVVEPLAPLDGVDAIRREIAAARTREEEDFPPQPAGDYPDVPPEPSEVRAGWRRITARLTG
ncbi:hypothetical protein [Actinoplanes utahensis]|uniref:Uncharacterized protein n=1 Tax=Actinoplanes utahensis TaxID=1869 RepID=A0A0A6U9C0_ACTUT|nr:hypothetical protein [Actinoplanes utahensis]KHD72660.1 hypothetical protein MB27_40265 [Actinoplanes utahensis]GIF29190.1 hypothetical protein Aut01nite_21760 [Actinoplanes utahensis]